VLSPHFKKRLKASTLIVPIACLAIYFSYQPLFRPIFALLVIAAISLGLWEFYQIAKEKKLESMPTLGMTSSAVYLYSVFLSTQMSGIDLLPPLVLLGTLLAGFLYFFFDGRSPMVNLGVTMLGIMYLTLPLSTLFLINFEQGRWWFLYLLLVVKLADTGAYFTGKAFGKHALAPFISPKKTWEGAIGGLICGIVASLVLDYIADGVFPAGAFSLSLNQAIVLGAVLSLIGQVGDLAESLLKRDAGMKDSNLLPGLGGMLDMVDSLIFTAPLLYLYLRWQT